MGDRIVELQAIIEGAHAEIRALMERLTPEDLRKRTENGWSVGKLAGHIAESPSADLYVAKRLADGRNATIPAALSFIIDTVNYFSVRKYGNTTRDRLLAEFAAQHDKLNQYVAALTQQQLDRGGIVFGRGRQTLYEYLKGSPSHAREHADSIERALAG
jgi:hypothetical protein